MRGALPLSAAASVVLFAALAVLSKGWLEPAGQVIFDARLAGYGVAEAAAYLGALTEEGRKLYLGLYRVLDTLLPLCLSLTLALLIGQLCTGGRLLRALLLLLPLVYLGADLGENAAVARLLAAPGGVDAGRVAVASSLTQLKWLSLAACLMAIAGGWLGGRARRRGAA